MTKRMDYRGINTIPYLFKVKQVNTMVFDVVIMQCHGVYQSKIALTVTI